MTYQTQDQLASDPTFQGRVRSCTVQQAEYYVADANPAHVALAHDVLRGLKGPDFTRVCAAGPGIADKVDNGDGTIDQAKCLDEDLLSLVQANWPVVAGLYYDADGNPKT
jgi:hypothetical protein